MNIGHFFPQIFTENNDWQQLCHEIFTENGEYLYVSCFREFSWKITTRMRECLSPEGL